MIKGEYKGFLRESAPIAIPISLQFLVSNLLNMMDTIMLGNLGEAPLAGVNAANQIFFIINLFLFGLSAAASIYSAQYYGAGKAEEVQKVVGITVLLGGSVALLGSVLAFFFPQQLVRFFAPQEDVVLYGSQYLHLVLLSYLPTAITMSYYATLKSVGHAKLSLYVSASALLVNTLLNYLLIYGKAGFPRLGVEGAAVATIVARFLELGIMLSVVYIKKYIVACHIRRLFSFSKQFFKSYLITALPLVANEGLWGLAFSMYTVVYGHMGKMELAAYTIAGNIERVFNFFFMGLSHATMVLVGRKIGAGKEEEAYRYGVTMIGFSVLLAVVGGILLILITPLFLMLYRIEPETKAMTYGLCVAFGALFPINTFNLLNIVGVIRSGGRTMFAAVLEITMIWFVSVPMAALAGLVLKLPVWYVHVFLTTGELAKLIIGWWWLKSKRWIGVIVER